MDRRCAHPQLDSRSSDRLTSANERHSAHPELSGKGLGMDEASQREPDPHTISGNQTIGHVKLSPNRAADPFRALGLRPVLLTGDNAGAAGAVASQVGIEEVHAGVTPRGKLGVITRLQAEGHIVAMVGDGVNDAAALAAADLGIAMGGGTDAAISASDITIISSDLLVVAEAVRLSRRTLGIIKGNLFWAFAYNAAAIPIAMLGLLNPLLAGAAMAFSSVFVVGNSLRLRRFRAQTSKGAGVSVATTTSKKVPLPTR
jgi:Cu+-exporting ATPase